MVSVEPIEVDEEQSGTIAAIINRAFAVEHWFVDGDRITASDVLRLAGTSSGQFFVARDGASRVGCVFTDVRSTSVGYIGLLAVEPARSGAGLGTQLMQRAEDHLRNRGCCTAEITVVDLRTDLMPFYARRGYRPTGVTQTFPRVAKQPCCLVEMTRTLDEPRTPKHPAPST